MIRKIKFYVMAVCGLAISYLAQAAPSLPEVGGLGITWELDQYNGLPRITLIARGLPAEQIHLQADDYISKIGDQPTNNLSADAIDELIQGPIGSRCYLTILRGNFEYPVSFIRAKFYPNWYPGVTDDFYHIKAGKQVNTWNSYPGYWFVNPGRVGDLRTVWKPGLIHPFYKVRSCQTEGYWSCLPGYRLLSSNSLEAVWMPGMHYFRQKIISGDIENSWKPYPGYAFKRQGSLEVVPVDQATTTDNSNPGAIAVVEIGLGAMVEYFFGPNPFSDSLYKAAGTNIIKSVILQ